MKEFRFSYFTVSNTVTIDDFILKIKSGPFIKKEFPLTNLQHFYVFDNKDYRSVYFLYTAANGKTKKQQVFATPAEMGFNELIRELHTRFPQKSLNGLPEAEAFKVMKTANPKKWAPLVAFLVVFAMMLIIFYPGLRHYFDFGFAETTVEQVAAREDFRTRNIEISGRLLDKSLVETNTKNGQTTSVSVYIPMVHEGWKKGDPVKVILSFNELSDSEYSSLLEKTTFTGVIRDVAWEGIGNEQTDFLQKNYRLNFPEKPVLVQITNESHNDVWALFALLVTLGIFGIVFLIVALKRR